MGLLKYTSTTFCFWKWSDEVLSYILYNNILHVYPNFSLSFSPFADVCWKWSDEPESVEAQLVGWTQGEAAHHRNQGEFH